MYTDAIGLEKKVFLESSWLPALCLFRMCDNILRSCFYLIKRPHPIMPYILNIVIHLQMGVKK